LCQGCACARTARHFGDYWRFGPPFLALFFVVAVFLTPVVWPF
jgi:di/tricarboxylate transporter